MPGSAIVSAPEVVILGAGLMGGWHGRCVRRIGGRIAAVVDVDRTRAERLARELSAKPFGSLDQLSDAQCSRVLHVCSPAATHAEYCRQGLERQMHVLCEKPLVLTAEVLPSLHALANSRRLLLRPVHQFGEQPAVRQTAREIADGLDARHIDFVFCTAGAQGRDPSGVRALVDEILPHPLSILDSFYPGVLSGSPTWAAVTTQPGEVRITTSLQSLTVSILISCNVRPTRAEMQLYCSDRTINHNFFHGYRHVARGQPGRLDKILRPFYSGASTMAAATFNLGKRALTRESAYPGLRQCIGAFYKSIHMGDIDSGSDIIGIYRARDAIARALAC